MLSCRWTYGIAIATCLVLRSAAICSAADPVLDFIPDSALAFGVVGNMREYSDEIDHFTGLLELEPPGVLKFAQDESGLKEGLRLDGSIIWVLVPGAGPDKPPVMLYFLPLDDFFKLRRNVPTKLVHKQQKVYSFKIAERVYHCKMKSFDDGRPAFAVFASEQDDRVLRLYFTENWKPIKQNVAAITKWCSSQDAYFVVTPAGIGANLQTFGRPLSRDNSTVERFYGALGWFAQMAAASGDQVTHFALGTRIDRESGVAVSTRLQLNQGGMLALWGSFNQGTRETVLAGMPNEAPALIVGGSLPKVLDTMFGAWLNDLNQEAENIVDPKRQAEQRELINVLRQLLQSTNGLSVLMSVNPQPDSVAGETRIFLAANDAANYFQLLRKAVALIVKIAEDGILGAENIQVAGRDATRVKLRNNGPEGWFPKGPVADVFVAPVDQRTTAVALASPDRLASAITAARQKTSITARESVKGTLEMLPPGSQWLALLDFRGMTRSQVWKLPGSPEVPVFPAEAPLGVGVEWRTTHAELVVAAPTRLFPATAKYVREENLEPFQNWEYIGVLLNLLRFKL